MPEWLARLNREVIACTRCPRLVEYRERIAREKRRANLREASTIRQRPDLKSKTPLLQLINLAPCRSPTYFSLRGFRRATRPRRILDTTRLAGVERAADFHVRQVRAPVPG